ncbi:hypothetical protein PYCCODRAFT_719995 [Trametes coccinea BRFM310]|uniref:Uncharacterized protein n=1 Tax=Trametes coccinea (strain BRFM310) TaxID=1353009 RepID=A0A1Y2IG53_TRAC3|nr:hypothetical protein PYCCODRAFT_719995 [Trametes coccinea BRFM310]
MGKNGSAKILLWLAPLQTDCSGNLLLRAVCIGGASWPESRTAYPSLGGRHNVAGARVRLRRGGRMRTPVAGIDAHMSEYTALLPASALGGSSARCCTPEPAVPEGIDLLLTCTVHFVLSQAPAAVRTITNICGLLRRALRPPSSSPWARWIRFACLLSAFSPALWQRAGTYHHCTRNWSIPSPPSHTLFHN